MSEQTVQPRPWEELCSSGLLWLINSVVFHPRGYAMALIASGDEFVGWELLGDGSEPLHFGEEFDDLLAAAEATFAAQLDWKVM